MDPAGGASGGTSASVAARSTFAEAPVSHRLARSLASPTGVLVLVPVLVLAVGITILLLGRSATRDATASMAREQLRQQALDVQHDVAFALDQAAPVLARLRELAVDPARSFADVALRMRDLQIGRPGIVNLSIGYANGNLRGTFFEGDELRVQESVVGATSTLRTNYHFGAFGLDKLDDKSTDYDVRKRPHYALAAAAKQAIWTPPRVYFTSSATGITCAEPLFVNDVLVAVITVDFDVSALSKFVVRAPLLGARTVVFSRDGTILAYPTQAQLPDIATREKRLLHYRDFAEPALTGLFDTLGTRPIIGLELLDVRTSAGNYLASVAPIGGTRGGVATPIDWYLASLVPEGVLLAPTQRFQKWSLLASAAALCFAVAIALIFAWNLLRMRRAVELARLQAKQAAARVKELGSYRLVERLGAGGMGEVWRAEHRLLARQAAVKLVRPDTIRDATHAAKLRERFRREATSLAAMRSRHTIALYDYGVTADDDPTFYFVMELLDGLDLDRLVKQHGPLPASRVVHLLAQACSSLAEAHEAGLVHRDIKPANLFVCRQADELDVVKVLDFGIVQSLVEPPPDPTLVVSLPPQIELSGQHKLTRYDSVIGTTGYIPPEHVLGEPVDARGDLYSLGCVAWWLLTGAEVYVRPDETATLMAHADAPIPELRSRVVGWFPPALEQLVLALLAKSPDQRPASARAVAAALRAIEIPPDHAWSTERAGAWWYVHRPLPDTTASASREAARQPATLLETVSLDTLESPFSGEEIVANRRQ